jgi:hypothetical protein
VRDPLRIIVYNLRSHWMSINLGRLLKAAMYKQDAAGAACLSIKQLREERRCLTVYLEMLRKVNQLTYYERLFSLWHVLHFPLFLMLVISGIIHVIAVHIY